MSTAASSRYNVSCPRCKAVAGHPCRTLKTGRVTDTHTSRIQRWHDLRGRDRNLKAPA